MNNCRQNEKQTIYDHGLSVQSKALELILILNGQINCGFKLPDWFNSYRSEILNSLLPINIIGEYTLLHDCGKPYCLTIDENGKQHFPNHAEISYQAYLKISNNQTVANLIRMDMLVHTIKACGVDDFIKNKECITLLIVGLAEIHSNADMFGEIESDSFKMKYKQINKRGKQICEKLFGVKNDVE